jgi:hypothetical protein
MSGKEEMMNRHTKILVVATLAVGVLVWHLHHQYAQLRMTYAHDLIQMDYNALQRSWIEYYKVSGIEPAPSFGGSWEVSSHKIAAKLTIRDPKLEGKSLQAFENFCSRTRPLCSFNQKIFSRSEVNLGGTEDSNYVYKWQCEF